MSRRHSIETRIAEVMMKKCAQGHLSEASAMLCKTCGFDLKYAEELFVEAEPGTPVAGPSAGDSSSGYSVKSSASLPAGPAASDDALRHGRANISEGDRCICKFPEEHEGACRYCGKRVSTVRVVESHSDREGRLPDRAGAQLVLPGLSPVTLQSGLLLGRDSAAARIDVALALAPFRGVSRRHLWMGVDAEGVLLVDLGSRNGTWVNGSRLEPFRLRRVPFAALPLTVRLGGALVATVFVGGLS